MLQVLQFILWLVIPVGCFRAIIINTNNQFIHTNNTQLQVTVTVTVPSYSTMTKKQEKKQQQKRIANLAKLQEFEDLESFEKFLRDEKEDNEFSHCHAHINYIPPFVLHESHNDPERVKDSQNRKNKKFVRHLHQHVEKHLLKEIVENSGLQLKFDKPEVVEDFDTMTWKYVDDTDHGLGEDYEHFKVEVEVKCNSEGAAVDVNYNTNVC